jgi:soluble lytic murein transglycosylase-like protein
VWHTPNRGLVYEDTFLEASRNHKIPDGLLSRVAYQESRYKPDAKNPSGATGIMQIVPRWHPGVDVDDPRASIMYAAEFLQHLHDQFNCWSMALAGYNWGPANLKKLLTKEGTGDWLWFVPHETYLYVTSIMDDVFDPQDR